MNVSLRTLIMLNYRHRLPAFISPIPPLPRLYRPQISAIPRPATRHSTQLRSSATLPSPSPSPSPSPNPPDSPHEIPTQHSLISYIRKKADIGAVRKVADAIIETEASTTPWSSAGVLPNSTTYRAATRALIKASRPDLAMQVYRTRMTARQSRPELVTVDLSLAANVLKAVLRDSKKRTVRVADSNLVYDDFRRGFRDVMRPGAEYQGRKGLILALVAVMNLWLGEDDMDRVDEVLGMIRALRVGTDEAMPVAEYNRAIRLLGKKRHLEGVFAVLDFMRASAVAPDNETFEFLANAAVRQVEFVTGAVSMRTLPEPLGVEVAFVGRSNVGKSSLVNMLCNRKALAYVSGRPGKTQQFNYFLVNGKDSEMQFYMVDLPGVGYAKVPKHLQDEWLRFMSQYFRHRTSLRMVFHLVDGRHGALEDDEELMRQMAGCGRSRGEYVVVLTKMDKMDKQKVKQSVLDKTKAALQRNGCEDKTPIVLTSSASRLGRDEMWRHLAKVIPTRKSPGKSSR